MPVQHIKHNRNVDCSTQILFLILNDFHNIFDKNCKFQREREQESDVD